MMTAVSTSHLAVGRGTGRRRARADDRTAE